MKISNQDCAKLGKTQAVPNMANPGHVTLIRIDECPLQSVSILDCCSSISSLKKDYGSAEDMSINPDTCRSSADMDKSFDLEDNFREKLNSFENIIEKVKNLHVGSNKNDDNKKNAKKNIDRTCRVSNENNVDNVEYRDTYKSRANCRSDNEDENNNDDDNVTNDDNKYCLSLNIRDEEQCLSSDDRNSNEDDDSEEEQERQKYDSDLIARGPIKPDFQPLRAGHPYSMVSSLLRANEQCVDVVAHVDYDKTAEQILRNKDYSEKLNPCLDQLSNSNCRNNQSSSIGAIVAGLAMDYGWTGENGGDIFHSRHPSDDVSLLNCH